MPTRVASIDLSMPLPAIDSLEGYERVLLLVRSGHRPVGLLRLQASQATLPPAIIEAALAEQLGPLPSDEALPPAAPLSIVVCTHERPDDLARCLDALRPAAQAGHEIIVVDNAPTTTRTADVAAHYPYRYLREPHVGLDNARNCGLRAARHSIVAFTDDDAAPDVAWVDGLAQPFADQSVACVTGLVLPIELETPAQEQFELYCAHRRDFMRRVYSSPELPPAAAGVVGMGANMAVRRELALRIGGFDPRLDGGTATCSGGDTDMFARILAAGFQIVYTPQAFVWHRHRRDSANLRRCIFGYGVGLYSFLTKRLIEDRDLSASIIAARWFAGPLVKAVWHRLQGHAAVPTALLALEAAGACLGPLRYWQETARMRASTT